MIIACATDEAYAEMAGVMLRSIYLNGDVRDAEIVLIGDRLSSPTRDALQDCSQGLNFTFIDLAEARPRIGSLPTTFYSTAIYVRFLLPELIRGSGRVLYLDSDVLVNGTLRPLFDLPLADNLLAAALDAAPARVRAIANRRLGRPAHAPYFNSGVLVFDLDTWRQQDIGGRCIDMANSREDFWPDQDAINLVLEGRIAVLDSTWNFFSHERLPRAAYEEARVVHFIPEKPLYRDCAHPLVKDYYRIRSDTPWRDQVPQGSLKKQRVTLIAQMAAERAGRWKAGPRNS